MQECFQGIRVVRTPSPAGVELMHIVWRNAMLDWCWQGVPVGKLAVRRRVLTCDWNGSHKDSLRFKWLFEGGSQGVLGRGRGGIKSREKPSAQLCFMFIM